MKKEHVTLACISPYMGLEGIGAYMERTYGTYFLRSKMKDEKYTTLVIEDAVDYEKITPDLITPPKYVPTPIDARDIAADFIQNANLESEGGFICAGDAPTEDELGKAEMRRHAWLVKSVGFGDAVFGRLGNRGIEQIPDYCKRAVAELGEIRDWVFQPSVAKVECQGCGNNVKLLKDGSTPAICSGCGALLDKEKAIALGLYRLETKQEVSEEETLKIRVKGPKA